MLNIAVLHFHKLGGSGVIAYELGLGMAEAKGHRIHFVGLNPPFRQRSPTHNRVRIQKVCMNEHEVFDFQPYTLALASQLVDLALSRSIDLIHSHYAIPHAIAALLAKQMLQKLYDRSVVCITTLHGTDITMVGSHPSMKHITKYAIEASDKVVAVSHALRSETEQAFGIAPNTINVVPNFINPTYYSGFNATPINERETIIILHSSNLRNVKNPLDLVRVFAEVQKRTTKPCELHIAGEGPLKPDLVDLAHSLQLQDQVKFLGEVGDLVPFMNNASFYLSTSSHESFGLSALEASACGLPIVASRVGGVPEVVSHKENGFLFDFGDAAAAAHHILRLIDNPKQYKTMSERARQIAFERFGREGVLDAYDELYHSMLAESPS